MNYKRKLAIALYVVLGAGSVSALVPVLDGELGVGLSARYGYDSNISANRDSKGDGIFSAEPSLIFRREQGILSLEAGAGIQIKRYSSKGRYDSDNPFAYIEVGGLNNPDNPWSFGLGFDYARITDANDLVGEVTKSNNYNLRFRNEYRLSDKFGVGFSPFLSYQEYLSKGFNNPYSVGAAVSGIYYYSEKLQLNVGYRYNFQETGGTPRLKSNNHTVFVGVSGELASKLEGSVDVGITYVDMSKTSGISNYYSPYVAAGVDWAVSEKTTVGLFSKMDVSQSPGNQGVETYSVGAGLEHRLNDQWVADSSVSYAHRIFSGNGPKRNDDVTILMVGLGYDINSWANARVDFSHQFNASNVKTFDYDRTQIFGTISAKF